MSDERDWWVRQKHIAERCLDNYRSADASVGRLADDMNSLAEVFESVGPQGMHEFEGSLPVPPVEWISDFRAVALDIEVIYSVAIDSDWDVLPPEHVAAVDQAVADLRKLLDGIPDA